MPKAATKPPANGLYAADLYAWTQEQARLLREGRWDDLDLQNLIDEVESVGGSEKREIESRLEVLIAHLLKWKYQPGLRGPSWRRTIREQRRRIAMVVRDSPSLKHHPKRAVPDVYGSAALEAADQTGIAYGLLPEECPFTPEQIFDPEFFPEDRTIE